MLIFKIVFIFVLNHLFEKGNFNGRKAIVEEGIIHNLSILFDDKEDMARKNAHKTVEMVSELVFGKKLFTVISCCKKNSNLSWLFFKRCGWDCKIELD
jgi:hypothetical protein